MKDKLKYEQPELISLNRDFPRTEGQCTPGSGYTGFCLGGIYAATGCGSGEGADASCGGGNGPSCSQGMGG